MKAFQIITFSPIIEGNQVSDSGSQVTIVQQKQISDLNAQDLPSALRRTPGVVISRYNPVGSFDVGVLGAQNQESWNSRFATCKDLLQYLCLMFGVVPSYSFGNEDGYIDADPANNLHRITLNSRGQNTQVTMAGDIKSKGSGLTAI